MGCAVLFTLLSILTLVVARLRLLSPPVFLSVDLALEFAYNLVTVVWVLRYADAFAAPAPPPQFEAEARNDRATGRAASRLLIVHRQSMGARVGKTLRRAQARTRRH